MTDGVKMPHYNLLDKDIRTCNKCGTVTDIHICWTDDGEYWCSDACVPEWKWIEMFGE
jgi:hypothetical protein|tara:strand:- start:806 stop:979 length:174 start_codon:yes stop_codon:yes gene_type:complete